MDKIIPADNKYDCRKLSGVWNNQDKSCHIIRETPKQILDEIWRVYNKKKCKNPKPDIYFRRQHGTALYWSDNKITLREDSWNKMHPAERRLTIIHETLHACGLPHREGFKTSQDYISPMIYERVYDDDFVIEDYKDKLQEVVDKYVKEV